MSNGARPQEVRVDDEVCKVWTAKEGKTWKAWGQFRSHHLDGSGKSEQNALAIWKKKANLCANE